MQDPTNEAGKDAIMRNPNDADEVMVAATSPGFWSFTCETNIKVCLNNARDVKFIAFLLTHRRDEYGKKIRSAITHIAEVKTTESEIPSKKTFKNYPELYERNKEKRDPDRTHKEYHLYRPFEELAHEKPHLKGEKVIRHILYTTMGELRRAKSVGKINKLKTKPKI